MKKINAKRMDLILVPFPLKWKQGLPPPFLSINFLWLSRSSWYSNTTPWFKEYFPLYSSLNPQTPYAQIGIPSHIRAQDCAHNQLNKMLTHVDQLYKQTQYKTDKKLWLTVFMDPGRQKASTLCLCVHTEPRTQGCPLSVCADRTQDSGVPALWAG